MRFVFFTLILFAAPCVLWSQTASDHDSEVLNAYFAHQLTLITETPGFTPPVASRTLGYTGLAAYESVVHGIQGMNSLVGLVPQFETLPLPDEGEVMHWPSVANHCLFTVIADLYGNMSSENLTALNAIRDDFDTAFEGSIDGQSLAASASYGNDLGAAILAYASLDGEQDCQFTNFPEYTPPVGDGLWSPLEGQQALQPYWGDKRCFVVEFVTNDMLSPEPPAFSTDEASELYQEALEVYEAVNNANQEEINIAEYWADGPNTVTPPGHSISMLHQTLVAEDSNLAFAAEAYARLGMGLSDAFVQCWKTKYAFNLLRPISYIQSHIDPEWNTIVSTPPFPEYTSGHSSQSGAFGSIMTALFGDSYAFTDFTHGDDFGGPRSFGSFMEAAEEAAISRLYGGIHYPVGNNMGLMSGLAIGDMVNALFEQAVGIDEATALVDLEVYPNPTSGQIRLNISQLAQRNLLVYDMNGRQVLELPAQANMDLSMLESGLYLLAIRGQQSGMIEGKTRIIIQ